MRIKICGLTRLEDAQVAAELGAVALGFIFAKESPRCTTPKQVKEITKFLPPFITLIGVFLDQEKDFIETTMQDCKLNIAQLHGHESPDFCKGLHYPVIKAFRVATQNDLALIPSYNTSVCAVLLDTKVDNQAGGTGKTFDWTLARQAKEFKQPIILAGGLTQSNIQEAQRSVMPYALDISSGVESRQGIKDHKKLEALFLTANQVP